MPTEYRRVSPDESPMVADERKRRELEAALERARAAILEAEQRGAPANELHGLRIDADCIEGRLKYLRRGAAMRWQ